MVKFLEELGSFQSANFNKGKFFMKLYNNIIYLVFVFLFLFTNISFAKKRNVNKRVISQSQQDQLDRANAYKENFSFENGMYEDVTNENCLIGYIGWTEGAPEFVFVNDVFRNMTDKCKRGKNLNKSCLYSGMNVISRTHELEDKDGYFSVKLERKNVNGDTSVLIDKKLYIREERVLRLKSHISCNYKKVNFIN